MVVDMESNRLKVVVYSAMPHEISAFEQVLQETSDTGVLHFVFLCQRLDPSTVELAAGARAVCLFTRDRADAALLSRLDELNVELIALRHTGIGTVDITKAYQLGIQVVRVPAHAPTSIAEYTVGLILALCRKIYIADSRARDGNMTLQGLQGSDLRGKTIGIIGTGKVGRIVARIVRAFGCRVLAYDMIESKEVTDLGARYVSVGTLLGSSDILTLHAPLVSGTHHMIGRATLLRCKEGVQIVNTSRSGLIDIKAAIEALQSGQMGGLAMDVNEIESPLFRRDPTGVMIDEDFQILQSLPNVVITGHLSALTTNAFASVARATVHSLLQFHNGEQMDYAIQPRQTRSQNGLQE